MTARDAMQRTHASRVPSRPSGVPSMSPPHRSRDSGTPIHHAAGNQAVQRLHIGRRDDPSERDADRTANAVLSRAAVGGLPRSAAKGGGTLGGEPLPDGARAYFEPRFGHDLSGVRIFTDARAHAAADALHARAFTVGQNILFGAAEYAPGTTRGTALLAHELAHTIQQRQRQGSTPLIQRQPKGDEPIEQVAEADKFHFNVERMTEDDFKRVTGLPSSMLPEGSFTDASHLGFSGLPAGTAPPGLVQAQQPAWLSPTESDQDPTSELDIAVTATGLSLMRVPYIGPRPYSPQELFDIVATDRAWSFNPGGEPVTEVTRAGAAAGGRGAGRTVFATIQIADRFGNRVDVALGQHLVSRGITWTGTHAEPAAMRALERSIPSLPDLRGGQMTVVVDQFPCSPASANCAGALRGFANRYGLGMEVYVPERPTTQAWRQGASVAPRTATMSSMRPDLPILETGRNYRLVPLQDMRVAPGEPVSTPVTRPWEIAGESPAALRGPTAFIRVGGTILTVYAAYGSIERLYDAWQQGSDAFVTVLVHETGTWTGGIAGAAAGGALARYACVYTGPFALACAVAMSLGGGWLGAKVGNWFAEIIMNIINAPENIGRAVVEMATIFGELGEIAQAIGNAPGQMLLENLGRLYSALDPSNWDVRYVPKPLVEDARAVVRAIWTRAGKAKDFNEFLSLLPSTLADVDVAPEVLERLAATLTALERQGGSGVVYTASGLLELMPQDFIKLLQKQRLRFVVDPEYMAGVDRPEDTERYRQVILAPLISQRASVNPANWKLDHLPVITENTRELHPESDLAELARTWWTRLGPLDQKEFGEAITQPLSAFALPPALVEKVALEIQSIMRVQGVGSKMGVEYTLPPETILQMKPETFLDLLIERDILRFRQSPSQIAQTALQWVRAGYQPW
jgi:hypothetical protein